ncbi:MAG: hypothetical protein KIT54_09725 [Phycisphaeraceae bacterium]|nr:hypothetical protein [Phycisphaeraceae bacterium]
MPTRRSGFRKNAIVTVIVVSPIAVLAALFYLLAMAYQAQLDAMGRTDQPRAAP